MAGKAVTKSQADKPSRSRPKAKAKPKPRTNKPKETATDDVTASQASFAEQYGEHG